MPAAEMLLDAPLIGETPGVAMPPVEPLVGLLMALPELPMAPI